MKNPIPIGQRFGRFTVIGEELKATRFYWVCRCDCGTIKTVCPAALRKGRSKSCGCWKVDHPSNFKHGLKGTAIDRVWKGMVQRCYNPKFPKYPSYGGRGIGICEFLRASPLNLLNILGEKPSPEHSIDRINNDGNYACGSCKECLQLGLKINIRWATKQQQARNRRSSKLITLRGETKVLQQWADETGLDRRTIKRMAMEAESL
jgi:hypothetical protein